MDVFVSWCPGLEKDEKAISILKDCNLIKGIEVWQLELAEIIRKSGMRAALHNPIKTLEKDLTDQDLIEAIEKEPGFFKAISSSDSKSIGFHVYYKIMPVYNHIVFNTPLKGINLKVDDMESLCRMIIDNLLLLEKKINYSLPEKEKKCVIFESCPYLDFSAVVPDHKNIDPEHQKIAEITGMFNKPEIIMRILNDEKVRENRRIGFLFDIAHVFCAVNGLAKKKIIIGSVDDTMKEIIRLTKGKVLEVHLNTPMKVSEFSYKDSHGALEEGNGLSDEMIDYTRQIISLNPQLDMITLEVDTGLKPEEHTKKLVEQAKLIAKELKLN